jgi:hypothetical protein
VPAAASTPGVLAAALAPDVLAVAFAPDVLAAAFAPGVLAAASAPGVPAAASTPGVLAAALAPGDTFSYVTIMTGGGGRSVSTWEADIGTGALSGTAGGCTGAEAPLSIRVCGSVNDSIETKSVSDGGLGSRTAGSGGDKVFSGSDARRSRLSRASTEGQGVRPRPCNLAWETCRLNPLTLGSLRPRSDDATFGLQIPGAGARSTGLSLHERSERAQRTVSL